MNEHTSPNLTPQSGPQMHKEVWSLRHPTFPRTTSSHFLSNNNSICYFSNIPTFKQDETNLTWPKRPCAPGCAWTPQRGNPSPAPRPTSALRASGCIFGSGDAGKGSIRFPDHLSCRPESWMKICRLSKAGCHRTHPSHSPMLSGFKKVENRVGEEV